MLRRVTSIRRTSPFSPAGRAESWSLTVPSEGFPAVIEHLRDAEVRRFFDKPGWCRDSYWSFPVLDPAGLTSEINGSLQEYLTPTDRPD